MIQLLNKGQLGAGRICRIVALVACSVVGSNAVAATVIWQNKDDFVRNEPADSPRPNSGPALAPLSTDAVRAVLSAVKISGPSGVEPFLDEDQVALLADPIARALRQAGPGEDVVFAAHYVSVMSIVGPPKSSAGRLWIEGDSVGVIVGQVAESYTKNFVALDPTAIRTGSHKAAQQSVYHILPGGAVSLAQADRGDWARISPSAWTGTYGMPVAMAPPAAPAAMASPPAMPTTPAAVLSAPPPADPLQIEQRFAALKRLLDAKMISESDYQHAKDDLLKAMSQLPGH